MDENLIHRLEDLRDRLLRNDPYLTCLEPWQGMESVPFACHYLESQDVQVALRDCLAACQGNTACRKVHLQALPEPELCQALQLTSALLNLQDFTVRHHSVSQSLPCQVLTAFIESQRPLAKKYNLEQRRTGLMRLSCQTRLQIQQQQQIQDLATAIGFQRHMQHLTLHLLPRCSIQQPDLSFNCLLEHCAALPQLQTLKLVAGYEHNPYGRPLVSVSVLETLLRSNQTALRHVELDNFGLTDAHVHAVAASLATTTRTASRPRAPVLERLSLPRNPHVSVTAWNAVVTALQTNWTLLHCQTGYEGGIHAPALSAGTTTPSSTGTLQQQESVHLEIQLVTFLNRIGRGALLQGSTTDIDWFRCLTVANCNKDNCSNSKSSRIKRSRCRHERQDTSKDTQEELLSLNASYTLLRLNPSLCSVCNDPQQQQRTQHHSYALRQRTGSSVPVSLLPRPIKPKTAMVTLAASAASASSPRSSRNRNRMVPHGANGSQQLFWEGLSR